MPCSGNDVAAKKRWRRIYKAQEHQAEGYDDFGEFSAHVAYSDRRAILRLRAILQERGVDPGAWSDPIPDA
jgi:hypothetical protein